jgi:hypothetical protein
MKRGKILQACMNLRGTRAWSVLGKHDADNSRDPDNEMLKAASDRQRDAYETAYLEASE